MEKITEYYAELGLDLHSLLILGGVLLTGLLLSLLLGRFIFGKRSGIQCAISSAITILFTYLGIIGIRYAGTDLDAFIAPMPFVTIGDVYLDIFQFSGAHYTQICSQVLRMVLLAFLVNMLDRWMPKKRNIFAWLFFRVLTVIAALFLHLIVCALIQRYLPLQIVTYAPTVLLGLFILLLLTGALKLLVGIVLTSVNPLIAALYTFFFATIVGKMLTRAFLTTGLLAIFAVTLSHLGLTSICISGPALVSYLPFFGILMVLWYFVTDK